MDAVGLYTNIPHHGGLPAFEQVLQGRACQVPPTADIIFFTKLVLELNSFTYNKQHYLQICGTAMGTHMAPSYANLFMGVLEKKILATAPYDQKPLFYGRFIDDVFGVWVYGEEVCWSSFSMQTVPTPTFDLSTRLARWWII